ncbi:MAG: hypothetical protein ABI768_01470 [Acidobacteriota bacterium]
MTQTRLVTNGILVVLLGAGVGPSFAQKAPKKPAASAAAPQATAKAAQAPAPTPAVPSRWKPIGPWIGNVQTLAVDPANPQNVFAGVRNGGVFRSTDAGATWMASADMRNTDVRRVAVDPTNPKHVLAGTNGGGLWASRDGGVTFKWQGLGGGYAVLYELPTRGVVFAPSDPNVVYATVMLKSANGGTTWKPLHEVGLGPHPNDCYDLAVDPKNPSVLYVGVNDGKGGVQKSTDGGSTWTPLTEGLTNYNRGHALAIDPSAPKTVYMGGTRGLFVTSDGGASWDKTGAGMKSDEVVRSLALDPKHPQTIFIGTEGRLYKSTDGGASVRQIKTGLPYTDFSALAADGDVVYAGTGYEGLFKSTDGGATFKESGVGLGAAFVWGLAADPASPGVVYVTNGLGLLKSDAAGAWKRVKFEDGKIPDKLAPVVDERRPGSLFLAAYTHGVFRSNDGGASWLKNPGKTTLAVVLALDPSNPNVVYAGRGTFDSKGGVWKSTDGGATFVEPKSGLPEADVTGIAVDGKNPSSVYASTEKKGLWKSADAGVTWAEKKGPFAEKELKTVAVDPGGRVFVGSRGAGAFVSDDGGQTWKSAGPGLPKMVFAFAFPPWKPGTVLAGTTEGVFSSADSGARWSLLGGSPLHDDVRHLAFDRGTPPRLYAGTAGGSVYALEIEDGK